MFVTKTLLLCYIFDQSVHAIQQWNFRFFSHIYQIINRDLERDLYMCNAREHFQLKLAQNQQFDAMHNKSSITAQFLYRFFSIFLFLLFVLPGSADSLQYKIETGIFAYTHSSGVNIFSTKQCLLIVAIYIPSMNSTLGKFYLFVRCGCNYYQQGATMCIIFSFCCYIRFILIQ